LHITKKILAFFRRRKVAFKLIKKYLNKFYSVYILYTITIIANIESSMLRRSYDIIL